jgi:hypothetical protein
VNREAQRLLDGGLAAAGFSAKELDSLPGSDVRKVALANLLLERTVARQSWPEIGDVQRSKRESTSSPIPCTETEVDGCLKRKYPVCQDLLTDPYVLTGNESKSGRSMEELEAEMRLLRAVLLNTEPKFPK